MKVLHDGSKFLEMEICFLFLPKEREIFAPCFKGSEQRDRKKYL